MYGTAAPGRRPRGRTTRPSASSRARCSSWA